MFFCRVLSLDKLLREKYSSKLPQVNSHNVAALPYSSGTTGLPKGVMITQCSHPEIGDVIPTTKTYQEVTLSVLPFFHIYVFNGILNFSMYNGGHVISLPRFTIEDYIKCLETYRPHSVFVVPSLLLFLITHPEITQDHLSSIKRVICGAAPATKNLIEKFKEKIGRNDCVIDQGINKLLTLVFF